ncbi:MAG TPA: transglutaminase family protein, partial [Propionibacteriaceae bacterium]|nr:transglutaminase family protein [Propionibacteriaceae bacterium]
MTSYRIVHRTTYNYDSEVTGSYGQFHLRPRDLPWQSCLAHEIEIDPEPADLFRHIDLYGNTKAYFHVVRPHTQLTVTATSVVEVGRAELDPDGLARPWEEARPAVRSEDPEAWEATDFTFPSPYIEIPAGIEEYARTSFTPGRPIGEAAVDLMHRVYADFTYKFGSTSVSTKVGDLLRNRTGVCQDFSHFMVSGLRSLGLAGRYVSGYLATRPPPGKPRPIGADASHAWVACWVPGSGWLNLDPTNNRVIDESHATVAWGRDYGDVP